MIKQSCVVLLCLAATGWPAARDAAGAEPPTPVVQGTLDGGRIGVFVTPRDSCSANDVPDAMARAFRDYTGTIHLVSASSDLYQSLGPTLENLTRSCVAAHLSANDPNPAHYNDQTWLDSFYTLDGRKIAALTHTEYHGWAHPGECPNPQDTAGPCEYDSDTYHLSLDGGYHFTGLKAPANYVAGFPYRYKIGDGPMGYSVDTNIIAFRGWYYAVATDWTWPPNCGGSTGPHRCLVPNGGAPLRTHDVFDPSSWRGWNGTDFCLTFVDPYAVRVTDPPAHVYAPVPYMTFVNGIYVYRPADIVVATLWDGWDNELGPPGLYLTTSGDMVNWTRPRLVVTLKDLAANDPKGSWQYAYFSLIDPAATDLNFATVGDHPYLYYVRLDNNSSGRVLFRQRVDLAVE
jgi:hypothetical protein